MSEAAGPPARAWYRSWKLGWFLFVMATTGLTILIAGDPLPGLAVFSVLASCSQMVVDMGRSSRLFPPSKAPRRFRFSIGQVMVLAALVAAYLGVLRALFTAYPIDDRRFVAMSSVMVFLPFAMFTGLGYAVWVGVRDVRAVMRGDRARTGLRGPRPPAGSLEEGRAP